jgi:hypothetical protein
MPEKREDSENDSEDNSENDSENDSEDDSEDNSEDDSEDTYYDSDDSEDSDRSFYWNIKKPDNSAKPEEDANNYNEGYIKFNKDKCFQYIVKVNNEGVKEWEQISIKISPVPSKETEIKNDFGINRKIPLHNPLIKTSHTVELDDIIFCERFFNDSPFRFTKEFDIKKPLKSFKFKKLIIEFEFCKNNNKTITDITDADYIKVMCLILTFDGDYEDYMLDLTDYMLAAKITKTEDPELFLSIIKNLLYIKENINNADYRNCINTMKDTSQKSRIDIKFSYDKYSKNTDYIKKNKCDYEYPDKIHTMDFNIITEGNIY